MKVSCMIFVSLLTFVTHSFGAGILPDRVRDIIDENVDVGKCFPNTKATFYRRDCRNQVFKQIRFTYASPLDKA